MAQSPETTVDDRETSPEAVSGVYVRRLTGSFSARTVERLAPMRLDCTADFPGLWSTRRPVAGRPGRGVGGGPARYG